ncbi:hypothetical protein JAAARDRAFT_41663 [Jaapia argillacea MUCL 33604]|uniref:F-box domain-containing protein n=1 Tax=Jaapia argillacea MUCL 33604 TaxID=933084 RepID=A0A067PIP4_9AGAM|nr:hypothetical protein JAAARDRAFT_41663 [Jaapia argillacea MUCL 33604]
MPYNTNLIMMRPKERAFTPFQKASPTTLPAEILKKILGHLPKHEIFHLCALNRTFQLHVDRALYSSIIFPSPPQAMALMRTFTENHQLAHCVRELELTPQPWMAIDRIRVTIILAFYNLLSLRKLTIRRDERDFFSPEELRSIFGILAICPFRLREFSSFKVDYDLVVRLLSKFPHITTWNHRPCSFATPLDPKDPLPDDFLPRLKVLDASPDVILSFTSPRPIERLHISFNGEDEVPVVHFLSQFCPSVTGIGIWRRGANAGDITTSTLLNHLAHALPNIRVLTMYDGRVEECYEKDPDVQDSDIDTPNQVVDALSRFKNLRVLGWLSASMFEAGRPGCADNSLWFNLWESHNGKHADFAKTLMQTCPSLRQFVLPIHMDSCHHVAWTRYDNGYMDWDEVSDQFAAELWKKGTW